MPADATKISRWLLQEHAVSTAAVAIASAVSTATAAAATTTTAAAAAAAAAAVLPIHHRPEQGIDGWMDGWMVSHDGAMGDERV